MKSFDLNSMGVQEMNAQESVLLNGGGNPIGDLLWYLAEEYIEHIADISEAYFNECGKGTYQHSGPSWGRR